MKPCVNQLPNGLHDNANMATALMKRRLLLVEDNQTNLKFREWLESEGFEVQTAGNVADAIAVFRGDPPHAVLLDVHLDAELDFVLWLRACAAPLICQTPVIAVTAQGLGTEQESLFEAGCNAVVSKPVNFSLLRPALGLLTRSRPHVSPEGSVGE
jgi:CheY-like chemotaxis protein